MKNALFILFFLLISQKVISQVDVKNTPESLLKRISEISCKCIDSIDVYNKNSVQISKEVNDCIKKQVIVFQMSSKLLKIENLEKKQIDVQINENSDEYKKYYYELETYMMENCGSLKEKIASSEKQSDKSVSKNKIALDYYLKGVDEFKNENFKKAVQYFEKAVREDPEFAFAWDNLGLSYRKLNNFDKAIKCYKKSLKIDPNGLMPLQNIAIVYQYKKEYQNAIAAYKKILDIDKDNPEVYYGIGNIYALNLQDFEQGLENMCKAYTLYVRQKSPYRADAEKVINIIYSEMKKQGKEEKFNQILKANNISPD